jgi:hypothetical protein
MNEWTSCNVALPISGEYECIINLIDQAVVLKLACAKGRWQEYNIDYTDQVTMWRPVTAQINWENWGKL